MKSMEFGAHRVLHVAAAGDAAAARRAVDRQLRRAVGRLDAQVDGAAGRRLVDAADKRACNENELERVASAGRRLDEHLVGAAVAHAGARRAADARLERARGRSSESCSENTNLIDSPSAARLRND